MSDGALFQAALVLIGCLIVANAVLAAYAIHEGSKFHKKYWPLLTRTYTADTVPDGTQRTERKDGRSSQ